MFTPKHKNARRVVEGRYSVDRDGVVWSGDLPLTPVDGKWVSVYGERRFVAYLVARAWVPNAEGRKYVRHKNGDARDNRAENLEWSESPERGSRRGPKPGLRRLGRFGWDGEIEDSYESVAEAAEKCGLKAVDIRAAANRKGSTGGWRWLWL